MVIVFPRYIKLRFVELFEILPFSMLTVGVIALSSEPWALGLELASRFAADLHTYG